MGLFSSKPKDTGKSTTTRKLEAIRDKYETYEQVQQALREAGLESCNLIISVDFTKSNEWTGSKTFGGKCLHTVDPSGVFNNPYQNVISVIGRTLQAFDDDKLIPTFGFGDVTTKDKRCFPFFPDGRPCRGFEEVLSRYNEITPNVQLAGPTSFAPVINEAIGIVKEEGGFHILIIIADGQVTNERETKDAIVRATKYPIAIIMVGVGDGPWDLMEEFDDDLPARKFDNFQFVDYNKVMQYNAHNPDIGFAISALMEVPDQFKLVRKLGLL
eukprot:Rmarinus@m.28204